MEPTTPIPPDTRSTRGLLLPAMLHEEFRAKTDDTLTDVIEALLAGWVSGDIPTPRLVIDYGHGHKLPVRENEARFYDRQRIIENRRTTVRVREDTWRAALALAEAEGTPLAPIINRLLRGYVDNKIKITLTP